MTQVTLRVTLLALLPGTMPRNEQLPDASIERGPLRAARPTEGIEPIPTTPSEEAAQRRLMPFLQLLIGLIAVFFLVATLFQLDRLQKSIANAPTLSIESTLAGAVSDPASLAAADRMLFTQWQTLAALEKNALERRYHQANVLLMSRTWTRYLGFVTGMIMALIGSGFILGKFREATSSLQVESTAVKAALGTASPGLWLATLGSAVMLATILVHNDIETRDTPMYINTILTPTDTRPELLRPREVPAPLDSLLEPFSGSPAESKARRDGSPQRRQQP